MRNGREMKSLVNVVNNCTSSSVMIFDWLEASEITGRCDGGKDHGTLWRNTVIGE